MNINKKQEYLRKHRWRLYVDNVPREVTLNAQSFEAIPCVDEEGGTLEVEFYGTKDVLEMLSKIGNEHTDIRVDITDGDADVLSSALYKSCWLSRKWPASVKLDYADNGILTIASKFKFQSCEVL